MYDFIHKKGMIPENLPLEAMFYGNLDFGRCLDYHVEYWRARHSDKLLIVHYEDMVKNMDKTIKMIANFMGF